MENTEAVKVPTIKNLEDLLIPHLNGSKILSSTTKYLTKPGDNYGSCMIAVSLRTLTSDMKEENLELVAKMPPLSEFYFKMFCPERTFRTENSIYLDVIPALENIENGLNIPEGKRFSRVFPKCFGGRINCTNDNEPVDRDALLVLENLVVSNFKPGNRSRFFGLEECEFILKNLAKFHAASIVLRKLKPKEFYEIKDKHFKKYDVESSMDEQFAKDFENVSIFLLVESWL